MKLRYYIKLCWLPLLFVSCERRPLEDGCIDSTLTPIGAVWHVADIESQNVTALFYDQYDGELAVEHRFENIARRIQTYADVPPGRYTVVLFNELRGQIPGVGIRGHENINTLEAHAVPGPYYKMRSGDDGFVHAPDIMASVMVRDFEVRENKVNAMLIGLEMMRKIHRFNIITHVKGLNNARMPVLVNMSGVAGSYDFSNDRNTRKMATQQFTMNNRVYEDDSRQDGTVSTTIYTFGPGGARPSDTDVLRDAPIHLDFMFMLVDEERTLVRQVVDITEMIRFQAESHGASTLHLYVELPDALPDVIPGGSDGSGFDSDVIDWDIIDVPLNPK